MKGRGEYLKNKLKIIIFVLLILVIIIVLYLNHIKSDILSRENIDRDDFVIKVHSLEKRVIISIRYPLNISIFNSPEFLYLVNMKTGEKVPPSEPYTKIREDLFWFAVDESVSKEDYELVINKIAIDVEEDARITIPAFPIGETVDFNLNSKLKYSTIKFDNIKIAIDDYNNLTAVAEPDIIPLTKDIELHGFYLNDSFDIEPDIFLYQRDGEARVTFLLDKSLEGEEQTIDYGKSIYLVNTDLRYKIDKNWEEDK